LRDDDIEKAIKNHQGDSIPGFPSIHAFLYLLSPRLQKLKEPALDLLNNIYTELRKLAGELIAEIAKKAPQIMDEMINLTDAFLLKLKQKAEEICIANIDSEIGYIFTNNDHYLEYRTRLIPATGQASQKGHAKSKEEKEEDGLMNARTGGSVGEKKEGNKGEHTRP